MPNHIEIIGASENNLKNINVNIPKGKLVVFAGVEGSGKSSLIRGEFAQKYPESIIIDQKPIGTSSRSTPATYSGVMEIIRKKFSDANGVGVECFSANSKGACPVCNGRGVITPDVAFADPVEIVCEECGGKNSTRLPWAICGWGKPPARCRAAKTNA
ncbi:ATP-binding cassette domain-containing protein [Rodentibacter haemolyticus]|uniref:ATP-binding cassette domain-containing protein n=1 Tax=Rodentibacter haemolyticus TaxID=2778911 RepID=UPI001E6329D8|nr:ATP-binding cassette domain-containing protein [Rodentibacter haemolyticus]